MFRAAARSVDEPARMPTVAAGEWASSGDGETAQK
jgi:hypothetical protein